jgi:hypothetical protein
MADLVLGDKEALISVWSTFEKRWSGAINRNRTLALAPDGVQSNLGANERKISASTFGPSFAEILLHCAYTIVPSSHISSASSAQSYRSFAGTSDIPSSGRPVAIEATRAQQYAA